MELESKLKAAYGELAKDRLEKKDWMQTRLLQIEHHFENISNEELELAKKRIQALDIEIEKLTSNEKNSAGIICSRRFGSFFRFNIHINWILKECLSQEKRFNFTLSEQLTKTLCQNLELESKLKAAHLQLDQNRLESEEPSRVRSLQNEIAFSGESCSLVDQLAVAKLRIGKLEQEIESLNEKSNAAEVNGFGINFYF